MRTHVVLYECMHCMKVCVDCITLYCVFINLCISPMPILTVQHTNFRLVFCCDMYGFCVCDLVVRPGRFGFGRGLWFCRRGRTNSNGVCAPAPDIFLMVHPPMKWHPDIFPKRGIVSDSIKNPLDMFTKYILRMLRLRGIAAGLAFGCCSLHATTPAIQRIAVEGEC